MKEEAADTSFVKGRVKFTFTKVSSTESSRKEIK